MGQMKQMSLAYSPVEDRFLFRINMQDSGGLSELRFWLTRRFVNLMWSSLEQLLVEDARSKTNLSPENRNAFMGFRQEAATEKTDFTTPYSAENAQTPLGPTPLLLQGYRASKVSSDSFALLLQTTDKRSITLNMNAYLLMSLRTLIAREVAKAQWDLTLNLVPGENTPSTKEAASIKLN